MQNFREIHIKDQQTDFASVAEAVAYFYKQGFKTTKAINHNDRVMHKDNFYAVIEHQKLLTVKVRFFQGV